MSNIIQIEFYSVPTNDSRMDFSGSYVEEFPNSTISFSGNYILIEDDNQVVRPFNLNTVKMYKIVSK